MVKTTGMEDFQWFFLWRRAGGGAGDEHIHALRGDARFLIVNPSISRFIAVILVFSRLNTSILRDMQELLVSEKGNSSIFVFWGNMLVFLVGNTSINEIFTVMLALQLNHN